MYFLYILTVLQGANIVHECKEGFYCFVGAVALSSTSDPVAFNDSVSLIIDHISEARGKTVDECPIGYFCPEGSPLPRRCPAGHYCDSPRMIAKDNSKLCDEGTLCISGAKSPAVDNVSVIDCPAGFYCEEGTTVPTMCPAGTYSGRTGLSSFSECDLCPEGFVCYQGQTTFENNECPVGFFCPEGTGNAYVTLNLLPNGDPNYELLCPPGYSEGLKINIYAKNNVNLSLHLIFILQTAVKTVSKFLATMEVSNMLMANSTVYHVQPDITAQTT